MCRSWPVLQLSCVKDSRGLGPERPVQRAQTPARALACQPGRSEARLVAAGEAICCYNNDTTGSHSALSGAQHSPLLSSAPSGWQSGPTISPPSPRSKKVISELGSAERQARVCFCLDFQHPSFSLLTLRWSEISIQDG